MCDNCARLQRQVRELKEEIAEYEARKAPVVPEAVRLQTKHDLSPAEGRVLHALVRHSPHIVTKDTIQNLISGDNGTLENIVRVIISRIRNKLPEGSVRNVFGQGYHIPTDKLEAIR